MKTTIEWFSFLCNINTSDMSYSIENFKNTIIARGGPVYTSKFLLVFPSVNDVVFNEDQKESAMRVDAFANLGMPIYSEAKRLPRDVSFLCTTATIPGLDLQAIAVQDYGPEHYVASGIADGSGTEIKLKIMLTNDLAPYYYFRDWMTSIVNETNWEIKFPNQYRKQMSLFLLGNDSKPVAQFEFTDAWPDNVPSIPLDWAKTDIINIDVSMTYRWVKRKNPMDELPV